MRILILLFALCAMLSSCATTPIGKIESSGFESKTIVVNAGFQEVYRNIVFGMKKCNTLGVPFGNIYTDINEAHIDIFMGGHENNISRESAYPYGEIAIKKIGEKSSEVSIKLVKRSIYRLSNSEIIGLWESSARGEFLCIE